MYYTLLNNLEKSVAILHLAYCYKSQFRVEFLMSFFFFLLSHWLENILHSINHDYIHTLLRSVSPKVPAEQKC